MYPETPNWTWPLAVIWSLLMVLVLFLNLPLGYLFWSSDQLKSPRNMYIGSMIVSDVLLGLVIPLKIYVNHNLHVWEDVSSVCQGVVVIQTFITHVNLYSVLGLTLVRHRFITRAVDCRQTSREAAYLIAFLWTFSFASSLRVPAVSGEDIYVGDGNICLSPLLFQPNLIVYRFFVDFCLPVGTIYVLCYHAKHTLGAVRQGRDPVEGATSRMRHCRVVRMVFVLVNCFAAFHLPVWVLNIVVYYHTWVFDGWLKQTRASVAFGLCDILMYCTGASNIIVYVLFNRRAAAAFFAFIKLQRTSQMRVTTMGRSCSLSDGRRGSGYRRGSHGVISLFRYGGTVTPPSSISP